MRITLSKDNYKEKLPKDMVKNIEWEQRDVSVDELISLIQEGYAFTSAMNGNRNRENYECSYMLVYDIDNSDTPMTDYVADMQYQPTFCYTSSSNMLEGKGYRFRMCYVLDEPICEARDYCVISRSLAAQLGIYGKEEVDTHSYLPEQFWFGSYGCEVIKGGTVYSLDMIEINPSLLAEKVCITQTNIYPHNVLCLTDTLSKDYNTMSYADLLDKYRGQYRNLERTPIELDEDTPIITYPDNYYEIHRPWKTVNGEIRKIRDGEGRRTHLYLNGIVRRKICPDITCDDMLLCMVYEWYNYYINDGNKIGKKEILKIVEKVMNADITDSDLGRPRYKSFINPLYCEKHNMTKKQVLGMTRNKQQYIGELYDPSLTDKENIALMAEYGLEISRPTLARWKRANL